MPMTVYNIWGFKVIQHKMIKNEQRDWLLNREKSYGQWEPRSIIGDVKLSMGWFWGRYMYVQSLGSRKRDDEGVLVTLWILTIFVLQRSRKIQSGCPKKNVEIHLLQIFLIFSWCHSKSGCFGFHQISDFNECGIKKGLDHFEVSFYS